jgi:hypothetical protein
MGFMDTRLWYLHNYRALLMFGLPLLLFAADEVLRGLVRLAQMLPGHARIPVTHASARRGRLSSG